jgi:carbamoyltransferase
MNIIGINAFHPDSSACLIQNGKLTFATEEERLNRKKHYFGFPKEAINSCLEFANLEIADIEYICVNSHPKTNIKKKLFYILKNFNLKFLLSKLLYKYEKKSVSETFFKEFPIGSNKIKFLYFDHHLCHLASSFMISGHDEGCSISVDGFGDFASTAIGYGKDKQLTIDEKVYFPHSLGIFYQAMTQFLGFKNYGDEYKLMGLSSYGKPKYINEISNIIDFDIDNHYRLNLNYFNHHNSFEGESTVKGNMQLFNKNIEDIFGIGRDINSDISQYHMDIASSVQKKYEDIFFSILNFTYDKYQNSNLSLSGGCAQNSLANGKIKKITKFNNVFIPPSPADSGGAVGAAILGSIKKKDSFYLNKSPYLGKSYTNEEIKELLENYETKLVYEKLSNKDLIKKIAKKLSENFVVGWFSGRAEWGPRALGNRSILCNPGNKDAKELLNKKIKLREKFRPFAPSVLEEEAKKWFKTDQIWPFMSSVITADINKANKIPAVVHIDGSSRLQTVNYDQNPKYYSLIKEFYNITKIPILLNTSFNENEPIVNTPSEAIECYLRTKMDILVIENYIISRV